MTFEIATAVQALSQASGGAGPSAGMPVQVGYGVSLSDFGGFQQALAQASGRLEAQPVQGVSEAARQLMAPFEHINGEASQIAEAARVAESAGRDMSPSEMINLTMRSQEFMFHCTLTSNIANRTSDGLSQLFRQQG